MKEIHPFGSYVPKDAKYLLLGTFPGKVSKINNWFYCAPRNQFWKILESVYQKKLATKKAKQKLLTDLKFAMSDVIYSCERKHGNHSDTNLVNIKYNTKAIEKIFTNNKIEKIIFTSRFAEKKFIIMFPNFLHLSPSTYLLTLPSPSPRYAKMSLNEKIKVYKTFLPTKIHS